MNTNSPSMREHLILTLIHDYMIENNEPPFNQWLAEQLFQLDYPKKLGGKDRNPHLYRNVYKNVLNLLKRLENKGYIERPNKRPRLTEKATRYFSSLLDSTEAVSALEILPVKIKLAGSVRAGRQNDIDIELDDKDDNNYSITIPDTRPNKKIYALEVQGTSMEHENIFEGDYVIVEEFDKNEWPKNGEMIVTKYLELPEYLRNDPVVEVDDFELSGHTLKIYSEVQENDYKFYRLSWRKDHISNPHMIKAVKIEPVGRVIGVYRKTNSQK